MTSSRLTEPLTLASLMVRSATFRVVAGVLTLSGCLAGCVSVTAPDKPIVIELNINISQEVIYRLADDARQNIEKNPGIF